MTTIEQREELRVVALNFLARRSAAAFSAMQLEARLKAERLVDFAFNAGDVADAMLLLTDLGLAKAVKETTMSVIAHYQATANGVLESERWRLERGLQ